MLNILSKIKRKKSSIQVSLALIGTVAISSCGEDGVRPVYQNLSDCAAEASAGECDSIDSDSPDYSRGGRYYGRFHPGIARSGLVSSTSRSVGMASVTRGGFGGSSSSHSSGG